MKLKTIRNIFFIISLVVIGFWVGYSLGHREYELCITYRNKAVNTSFGNKQATGTLDLALFWDVFERLKRSYISRNKIDLQKMLYGAISGMVSSLDDPYTVFLIPKQNKETKEELGGSFTGIGAQLGLKDKKIVVIAPLPETPAEKAGIKAGDWILAIDNKSTDNLSLPEAVSKIRGQKGTKVVLNILHEKSEKPLEFSITRDTIVVKSVEYKEIENIAYVKLASFGDQTEGEWTKAIQEIRGKIYDSRIKGVVLDLRSNPGGYLTGAIFIAGEFLERGKVVVYQENADGSKKSYPVDRDGALLDMPLVVLINRGSASASEIVAGAMRDYERATLVGEKSFGKGSIQEPQDLPGGSGLHITTAKWLTPKEKWINGTGITPSVLVSMDEKNPEKDPQLEKAIEILNK